MVDQAIAAGPENSLVSKLWVPWPDLPGPVKDWELQFCDQNGAPCPPFFFQPSDKLFTDGSAFHGDKEELARGGVSVVHMEGEIMQRGVWAPLPCEFKQQAADTENAALAVSVLRRDSTPEECEPVNVDCASLFAGTRNPSKALDGASRLSFFWRELARKITAVPEQGWPRLNKIKAHRSMNSAVDDADRATIAGSDAADSWAKKGAQAHDLSPTELEDFERGENEYTSLALGVISIYLFGLLSRKFIKIFDGLQRPVDPR